MFFVKKTFRKNLDKFLTFDLADVSHTLTLRPFASSIENFSNFFNMYAKAQTERVVRV